MPTKKIAKKNFGNVVNVHKIWGNLGGEGASDREIGAAKSISRLLFFR
jgi:hypothetical protein